MKTITTLWAWGALLVAPLSAGHAAAVTLAPQYTGSFGSGSGAAAAFYQIDSAWHGSTVLWDEASGSYGSGVPIGTLPWGTGLWGRADFDIVVCDLTMPGLPGKELLKRLVAAHPDLPVLILSMYPEEQYALRALRAGAAGYLSKDAAPDLLLTALRKVASGGRFVTPAIAEQLAARVGATGPEYPHESLSDREFQVLRLIASGKPVSVIAEELSLSVKTVSTYRARVLTKLSLRTNADLTRYALDNGLAD